MMCCGMQELYGIQQTAKKDLLKWALGRIGRQDIVVFAQAAYRRKRKRAGDDHGVELKRLIEKHGLGRVHEGAWRNNPIHGGAGGTKVKAFMWTVDRKAVDAYKKRYMKTAVANEAFRRRQGVYPFF